MTAETNLHRHVIERFDPTDLESHFLLRRAEQLGHVMDWVQEYYMQNLGLVRVGKDAPPLARRGLKWRQNRVETSGPLDRADHEYIIARRIDPVFNGRPEIPSEAVGGICGLVILEKEQPCSNRRHTSTELVEFDVRAGERGRGLGRAILKTALEGVHPADQLTLDVAEPNYPAQQLYQHLGFEYTGGIKYRNTFAYRDGQAMPHFVMTAPARVVQQNLS